MSQNPEYVLILEKSLSNLNTKKEGEEVFLEGIAAVFGKENSNQRIYEEREYLPHLEYLKEKINQKRLVGELDHPKEFDVSLKNISHVIEDLNYIKEDRTVRIKVRLLDTPAGKIAKSLVEAGIPVSISSRAAGSVGSNKKVEIKKIFTYDLVADPGFENAQLERVYESFGFNLNEKSKTESVLNGLPLLNENLGLENDSNFKIYRIKDQEKIEKLLLKENSNKQTKMESNFVTAEELNEYSKLLKREMDSIKTSIDSLKGNKKIGSVNESSSVEERLARLEKYADYLAENLEASVKYGEYLAENLEGSIAYGKYLGENLDKAISYGKYLAEHIDNNISYSEYIAESVDKNISAVSGLQEKVNQAINYSEYVAENVDKNIKYTEYLAENLDKNISYAEYLAENLDKNISYSEYLAENLDKNISYADYLAENLDKNISYSEYLAENLDRGIAYSEYLGENLDKNVRYSEYLAEKLSTNISYSEYIAESLNKSEGKLSLGKEINEAINESKSNSGFAGNYNNLTSKIDSLLESVNKQKTEEVINEKKYTFLRLLDEKTQKGFLDLNEAEKQKVVKALNENNYSSEKEVMTIMGNALTEQVNSGEKFLDMMPEAIKPVWEQMNEGQKASIIAQAKLRKLETPYQIHNFWSTRGIDIPKANVQALDESIKIENPVSKGYDRTYLNSIAEEIGRRFK